MQAKPKAKDEQQAECAGSWFSYVWMEARFSWYFHRCTLHPWTNETAQRKRAGTGKNDDVYAILRLKVLLAYLLLLTNIKLTIYRIHQQTTTPPIHEHLAALGQQNSTVSKTTKSSPNVKGWIHGRSWSWRRHHCSNTSVGNLCIVCWDRIWYRCNR